MSIFEDKKEFMLKGDCSLDTYDDEQSELYEDLINEEYTEFRDASVDYHAINSTKLQAEAVKECVDLIYVCSGWLFSQGIDPQKAWDIVHNNNMAKVNDKVVKNDQGKIQKSPESIARKKQMMIDLMALVESDD